MFCDTVCTRGSAAAGSGSELAGFRRAGRGGKSEEFGGRGLRGEPDDSNDAAGPADAGEHDRERRQDAIGELRDDGHGLLKSSDRSHIGEAQ